MVQYRLLRPDTGLYQGLHPSAVHCPLQPQLAREGRVGHSGLRRCQPHLDVLHHLLDLRPAQCLLGHHRPGQLPPVLLPRRQQLHPHRHRLPHLPLAHTRRVEAPGELAPETPSPRRLRPRFLVRNQNKTPLQPFLPRESSCLAPTWIPRARADPAASSSALL